jgi:hypothetical protein
MSDMSRRSFLGQSTVAAAAVTGTAALAALAVNHEDKDHDGAHAPEPVPAALAADFDADQPIILHIADAGAGQIDAYVGDRMVSFTDRALVARVVRAKV